ncbi:hypothetical protein LOK49_LG13G01849 [Camellia lanceoleosa]|uniref:Uncharacterized protein n=1 Tax=Camellia lanceoleosa TaxID=1840588 RepID=A0ACC0FMV6_9ERIC|nr:hypothetical protein LOK49_LG13G01849 [Camellia lanceoleosa]
MARLQWGQGVTMSDRRKSLLRNFVLEMIEVPKRHVENGKMIPYSSITTQCGVCKAEKFPSYPNLNQEGGVLASGALHWVVTQEPKIHKGGLIVGFDLGREEYEFVYDCSGLGGMPIGDVAAAEERIANPDHVVAAFPV